MSRIGYKVIEIPSGVEIKLDGNNVIVKGSKGELSQEIDSCITVNIEGNEINLERASNRKDHASLHGLSRTLIANMIEGVTEGFSKTLKLVGVGYRAQKQGNKLLLTLGFSHPVEMIDPEGIEVEVKDDSEITISGINKQKVGNYAAVIREWRKPEPYKGKGVRYVDEYVRRKEGKKTGS